MGFSMVAMGENRYDILSGKKQIGRVCQHADGTWIGVAGKYIIVRGCHSAKGAFNETVAQWLRYDEPVRKKYGNGKKQKPRTSPKSQIRIPQAGQQENLFRPEQFTATWAQMKDFSCQQKVRA